MYKNISEQFGRPEFGDRENIRRTSEPGLA
jgi:hypothetical protein